MKFKVDENLPLELLTDLRVAGHEAETVSEEGLTGAPDTVLLEKVRSEERVLLTMDKGIANVRVYPPEHYSGYPLSTSYFGSRRSSDIYPSLSANYPAGGFSWSPPGHHRSQHPDTLSLPL